jgi:hypothetical protein
MEEAMRAFDVAERRDGVASAEAGPIVDATIARKFFIVEPGNEQLYAALCGALAAESDVEIFYDRRDSSRPSRWNGAERRACEVSERIRSQGFAVVRLVPPAPRSHNIRWA